jgi:hypothetical protein
MTLTPKLMAIVASLLLYVDYSENRENAITGRADEEPERYSMFIERYKLEFPEYKL